MSYNYPVLFAKIVDAVTETGSITARMHQLIKHCEEQVPHEDWDGMRQIDYEADRQTLGRWLVTSFAEADPWLLFKGLWFGIHNLDVRGQSTADIYVSASTKFEPKSLDWAVAAEFFPDARYLNSTVLASIYRLAYTRPTSLGNDAEYPLSLAYGAMAACAALHSARFTGPFAHLVGAAAGFDDGDLLFLGSFSEGKFCAMPEAG